MKAFKLIIFLFWISLLSAQVGVDRKLCWEKSMERQGQRYVDWECGKSDQIVDCNERLETDHNSSMVVHRKTGRPFSGRCETCHPNGIRERIVTFEEGYTDGSDTTTYPSGCTQVVRTHIKGAENGTWTYYNDSSGLVAWKINFLNGEKHGESIYYSHNLVDTKSKKIKVGNQDVNHRYGVYDSDTLKIEHYKDGRLHGPRIEYFPTGDVKKEVHYKEGKMHGPFLVYNEEGTLLQELSYEEGKKDGEWKYYYESGDILKIENWDEGTKRGDFKSFYIQGHIQESEVYDRRGRKHGWFEKRFPDDKVKRRALYRRDELVEEHVYDEYGNEIRTVVDGEEKDRKSSDDDEAPEVKSDKKWWQFWKWFSKD